MKTNILLLLTLCAAVPAQETKTVNVVIRDFFASHPDFQESPHPCGPFMIKGLVQDTLDNEGNPLPMEIFPSQCQETPSQLHIGDWFRTTNDNAEYCIPLILDMVPNTEKTFQLVDAYFFPLDTVPTATEMMLGDDGLEHNFHFCMEMHSAFKYEGGEVFNFYGDDDAWVFINNMLALDLGNVHQEQEDSVALDMYSDKLGIGVGGYYNFDFFYCERQASGSHFKMTTNIDFIPPPPPGLYVADFRMNIPYEDTLVLVRDGIPDTLIAVRLRNQSDEQSCTTTESQIKEWVAGTWTFGGAALPAGSAAVIEEGSYTNGTYALMLSDGVNLDVLYVRIEDGPQSRISGGRGGRPGVSGTGNSLDIFEKNYDTRGRCMDAGMLESGNSIIFKKEP